MTRIVRAKPAAATDTVVPMPRRRIVRTSPAEPGASNGHATPDGKAPRHAHEIWHELQNAERNSRHVSLDKRKKGWPRLAPGNPDTQYRVSGIKVIGFVTTTASGLLLGWDLCGRCKSHITTCRCSNGCSPQQAVVYCYRQHHPSLDYKVEIANRGAGYLGLVHDPVTSQAKGIYVESPINRRRREALEAGENPDAPADRITPPTPARRRIKRAEPVPPQPPVPARRVIRKKVGQ